MELGTIAARLTSNVGFVALYLCLLLSVFSFLAGSIRAWGNGSFDATLFHGWIKKDGPPIAWVLLWLTLGAAVSLVDVTKIGLPAEVATGALTGFGILQAATFVVAKLASIKEDFAPNPAAKAAKVDAAEAAGDPQPKTV